MNRILSWFCKIFLAPLVGRLFVKEVRGLENIPKGSFILVSNHQSYLDIVVDGYVLVPRPFCFIGQIDGFRGAMKVLIRALYFISGVIPLDRKNEESRKKAIEVAVGRLKKGYILALYPEGKRSLNGEMQEGKLGTAKIFLKTNVPILPVGIRGPFELLPPKGKLKIKRIVEVNIGTPLFFEKELEEGKKLGEEGRGGWTEGYYQIIQRITDRIMDEIANLVSQPYGD